MDSNQIEAYILGIQKEIAPATGCTEPAAVALCAAAAAHALGDKPGKLEVAVSEYIFKNAMNVGIPGTDVIGLDIASALGAVCARPEKKLLVLSGLTDQEKETASALVAQGNVSVRIAQQVPKVYVHVTVSGSLGHTGEAVLENGHEHLTLIKHDSDTLFSENMPGTPSPELREEPYTRTLAEIWEFSQSVDPSRLAFLDELIRLNDGMACEGLERPYGLQVGQNIRRGAESGLMADDLANYAVSVTAAAADARMSGCERSVMSVAGSGNQGLTATLPLIALARKMDCPREQLYRSLALSILVTVHVKRYIGKLSVLCGCSIAAAIGVAVAIVYLRGGTFRQAEQAVNTMVADISGVVCDGAKPGCALKIATSVTSAVRAASMAISDIGATGHDGIVDYDAELSLKNLGTLGNVGMDRANETILDMMLHKKTAEETTA